MIFVSALRSLTPLRLSKATDVRNSGTLAGLPVRVAITYAILFAFAYWFYSVMWAHAPVMGPDSTTYLTAAQDLSDFHIDELQLRTPGYPLLLWLTGSHKSPNRTLFFSSLSLHFVSIWLLAGVLSRVGFREYSLDLFGFILILPPYVEPAAYVLTENLTEALLVAGFGSLIFWMLRRGVMWLFLSTLTIGYAALTRPTYQLLALFMAGWLLLTNCLFHSTLRWKDVAKGSLILVSGSLLMMGTLAFLNYRSVGYFGLATPVLGLALTQKTARVFERLPDEHAAVRETLIRARNAAYLTAEEHTGLSFIDGAVSELVELTGLEKAQLSDLLLRLNFLLIQKAPLNYLREVIWSFGSYWLPSSGELANFDSRFFQLLWSFIQLCLIGAFAANLILLGGAGTYIKMCTRSSPRSDFASSNEIDLIDAQARTYSLAAVIVFYSMAITCLVQEGIPRYRVPTDGLIVFMLFLGTDLWWRLVELSRIVFDRIQNRSA